MPSAWLAAGAGAVSESGAGRHRPPRASVEPRPCPPPRCRTDRRPGPTGCSRSKIHGQARRGWNRWNAWREGKSVGNGSRHSSHPPSPVQAADRTGLCDIPAPAGSLRRVFQRPLPERVGRPRPVPGKSAVLHHPHRHEALFRPESPCGWSARPRGRRNRPPRPPPPRSSPHRRSASVVCAAPRPHGVQVTPPVQLPVVQQHAAEDRHIVRHKN